VRARNRELVAKRESAQSGQDEGVVGSKGVALSRSLVKHVCSRRVSRRLASFICYNDDNVESTIQSDNLTRFSHMQCAILPKSSRQHEAASWESRCAFAFEPRSYLRLLSVCSTRGSYAAGTSRLLNTVCADWAPTGYHRFTPPSIPSLCPQPLRRLHHRRSHLLRYPSPCLARPAPLNALCRRP